MAVQFNTQTELERQGKGPWSLKNKGYERAVKNGFSLDIGQNNKVEEQVLVAREKPQKVVEAMKEKELKCWLKFLWSCY